MVVSVTFRCVVTVCRQCDRDVQCAVTSPEAGSAAESSKPSAVTSSQSPPPPQCRHSVTAATPTSSPTHPPDAPKPDRRVRRATAIADSEVVSALRRVLAAAFVATFAVAMVAAAIGELVEDDFFDGDSSAASLFVAAVAGGSSALEFLTNPLLGAAADHYGRRPLALVGLTGNFLSISVIAAYPSKGTFIAAGVIRGLTSVSGAMFFAMISDLSEDVQRESLNVSKNTGYMLAAAAVGLALGPAAGGALSLINVRSTFIGAAVVQLVAILFTWKCVPETRE